MKFGKLKKMKQKETQIMASQPQTESFSQNTPKEPSLEDNRMKAMEEQMRIMGIKDNWEIYLLEQLSEINNTLKGIGVTLNSIDKILEEAE